MIANLDRPEMRSLNNFLTTGARPVNVIRWLLGVCSNLRHANGNMTPPYLYISKKSQQKFSEGSVLQNTFILVQTFALTPCGNFVKEPTCPKCP